MFKVKNEVFNNPQFLASLQALSTKDIRVDKGGWNLSRVYRKVAAAEAELREEVKKLSDKYFKKDPENGSIIPVKKDGRVVQSQFEVIEEDGQEKFEAEFKALLDIEVEIESFKIKLSEISHLDMKATDLVAIDAIIEE